MSNVNNIIKDTNIKVEPVYKAQTEAFGVFDYPFLIDSIKSINTLNFLDIGTGDGTFLINLAQKVTNVFFHGIDLNEHLIEQANIHLENCSSNISFSLNHFGVDNTDSEYDFIW